MRHFFILFSILLSTILFSGTTMASGGKPSTPQPDPIDDFANSWAGKTLRLQSQIDRHAPMSTNNILGSHNSYNSSEYANDGYPRYIDPQQKHTLKEQLRLGARFIELDVHWTLNGSNFRRHLMLCHSPSNHLACSLNDRYLREGLQEIREWLSSSESDEQVIILYIEDHSNNRHSKMYSELNDKIGQWVYRSNGCRSIPNNLTKHDVLSAGKKVVIWKDGRDNSKGCSDDNNLKNMVFTGLGNIDRIWEDRTFIGGIFSNKDKIEADDLKTFFADGRNIVNLDDMTHNDGRNTAAIWSWNVNEPNNANNEDCAVQTSNGRWNDVSCNTYRSLPYACVQRGTENWTISPVSGGNYFDGNLACAALGSTWQFAVPTNSKYNTLIQNAARAAGASGVWLNINDRAIEGKWSTPDL